MRYAKRIICTLLAALTLVSALSGCSDRNKDADGLSVSASVCAPIASFDPAFSTDASAETVFHALYENLMSVRMDETGSRVVETAAAKEYQTVENFDGTVEYIFTLRSSARWSDGTRVKAKDFVYAWRRLVNPATDSPNAAMLSMVSGYEDVRETGDATRLAVRADGDSKLRVTLDAPCSYFISDVCSAVATMPLRSDAVGKNPDWATSTNLPCNGPFRISVWAKKESILLRRNDHYRDARTVAVGSLRFLFAGSTTQAMRYYDEELADYVAPAYDETEGVGVLPRSGVACALYNHMSPALSNAHLRRAFDLAIDRVSLAETVRGGRTPATGLVPPGLVNVNGESGEDFRVLGGELIAVDEEGYSERCFEAEREMRLSGHWGGVDLPELTCVYVTEEPTSAHAATALAHVWQEKLSAAVRIEGLSREDFYARVDAGEYDIAVDTFRADGSDAMAFLEPWAGLDGSNALHYVSKPYDLLIGVARTSRDLAARAAMLHDAEVLLLGDTALSPLWFEGRTYLLRDGLTGIRHDARGNAYFDKVHVVETLG